MRKICILCKWPACRKGRKVKAGTCKARGVARSRFGETRCPGLRHGLSGIYVNCPHVHRAARRYLRKRSCPGGYLGGDLWAMSELTVARKVSEARRTSRRVVPRLRCRAVAQQTGIAVRHEKKAC